MSYSNSVTYTRESALSESAYIRAIGLLTFVMGAAVTMGAKITHGWPMNWPLLIVTFGVSLCAIYVFNTSSSPTLSFAGVAVMSVAMGFMIGPLVAQYKKPLVLQAVVITAIIMVAMSAIGIIFPALFKGWGPYVMAALVLLIFGQFAQIVFVALGFGQAAHMPILLWAGILIFMGIVAYDWSQALEQEYTWDNAIKASGGIILDAINIFIRVLGLLGDSDD